MTASRSERMGSLVRCVSRLACRMFYIMRLPRTQETATAKPMGSSRREGCRDCHFEIGYRKRTIRTGAAAHISMLVKYVAKTLVAWASASCLGYSSSNTDAR